nr:methyltransferase domain protein [Toxoplasma gondii TgCATBr9]
MLSMTFPEFLAAAAADPVSERGLKRWLERLNATSRLDKPQFEAFSLYKVFVFKKATASAEKAGAALHRASQGSTASAPSSQLSPLGVPSSTEPQVSQPSADLDAQLSGDVQSEKRLGSGRHAEQAGVYVHPSAQLAGPARGGEQVTLDGSFPADRNALLAGVPLKRKTTKRAQNLNEDL